MVAVDAHQNVKKKLFEDDNRLLHFHQPSSDNCKSLLRSSRDPRFISGNRRDFDFVGILNCHSGPIHRSSDRIEYNAPCFHIAGHIQKTLGTIFQTRSMRAHKNRQDYGAYRRELVGNLLCGGIR